MVPRVSILPRASGVVCTFAVVACAEVALAQSEGSADDARTLFREARGLVAERQYTEACPKFEQSLRIERGIGTMYNLADCWEKLGKTASAHRMFLVAAEAARAAGQSDRSRTARERAVALAPKLSHLLVTVGTPSEGMTVWREKKQIHQDKWGTATPVDPGIYELRATAPGKLPWSARVEIPELATTVSVTVPPLAADPKSGPAAVVPAPKPKAKPIEPPRHGPAPALAKELPPQADTASGNNRLLALSVGAAGAGALVAGFVLALDYRSKNDEARDICPSARNCSRAEIDRHSELVDGARSSRNWSYLAFGVGGAAVLSGGAIYVTSATTDSRKGGVRVTPLVCDRGPLGAFVHGKW
jgi:hypothetical protein